MTVAGRDRLDPQQIASARRTGPPGIDWTHPAPECPACWRRWLASDLPLGSLLSHRTQAALTAAALAVSATTPGAVLAAGHHGRHGAATPKQVAPNDPALDPDSGPQGPAENLPDAPNEPEEPDDPDAGAAPSPSAPSTPIIPPQAATPPDDAVSEPDPPTDDPAPVESQTPPSVTTPTPAPAPAGSSAVAPVLVGSPDQAQHKRHIVYARSARSHRSTTVSSRPPMTTPPAPRAVTRAAGVATPTAVPDAGRARPGDRVHVVRRGESLWSIARDHLGGGVPTGEVAREAARLWSLNESRIGTGDPDLLMAGTRLVLNATT